MILEDLNLVALPPGQPKGIVMCTPPRRSSRQLSLVRRTLDLLSSQTCVIDPYAGRLLRSPPSPATTVGLVFLTSRSRG